VADPRYERIEKATHGRWYSRVADDPINSVPDLSPAQEGAVDMSTVRDTLPTVYEEPA